MVHILIGGHVTTAPRAQKEALALKEAGHAVRISGVWFDREQAARDREWAEKTGVCFSPALDFRRGSRRNAAWRLAVRCGARWAREKFTWTGKFSPELLGYGARDLLVATLKAKADLTIVHCEAALWVARELLRRGRRVGVDLEDWFSQDLPVHARKVRPCGAIAELERVIVRRARYLVVPSFAMADAVARAYEVDLPTVIYNVFNWAERAALDGLHKDRTNPTVPSLHWFSQTIGPDRGLELLFAALPLLRSCVHIYLRGACSAATRCWLDRQIPAAWRKAVTILPPVSQDELLSRIAEHDIGLALESAEIPSRDLTVTNKLFQYLLAGLPIIATDTQGQREVLARCGAAGTLLPEATPVALAQAIDRRLAEPGVLQRARQAALDAVQRTFCWERQKTQVVLEAERALASGS